MTYLLDANVFIQAKNLHYGLDFCPAFWEWLAEKNAAGKVFSIDKIADELEAGADELTRWARQEAASLFRKTDAQIVPQFAMAVKVEKYTGLTRAEIENLLLCLTV